MEATRQSGDRTLSLVNEASVFRYKLRIVIAGKRASPQS